MIDWNDPVIRKAYKAGYMRGTRLLKYKPNPEATPLARQVMLNEFERARRHFKIQTKRMMAAKKHPQSEGNLEWKEMAR